MNIECHDGQDLAVRAWGSAGPALIVLHGGPGAAGYMAPVCRELSSGFEVIEPLQRMSGPVPLTVAQHVEDLRRVIEHTVAGVPVTLVGHSWGAMLALVFAAENPTAVRCLVLIGCGTFDLRSRSMLQSSVERRMSPEVRTRLRCISRVVADPDVRMCVTGRVLEGVYSHDLEPHKDETEYYDSRGREGSWRDMLRLQREGVYPARFSSIDVPVLMLHGAQDPHPGREVFASLAAAMPRIEYSELQRCGHYPWWERHAKDEFYGTLGRWLASHST